MKQLIFACTISLILFSCKKDAAPALNPQNLYVCAVLAQLRDSLSPADYFSLDTNKTYLTDPGKTGNYLLRIGFKGKPIAEDFLLVHTDNNGTIQVGSTVHLENTTPAQSYQFSGSISLKSLSGKTLIESDIVAGHILSLHKGKQLTTIPSGTKEVDVLPAPDADWLPEVVVVGYSGGGDATPFVSLDALLGGVTGGSGGLTSGGSSDNSNAGGGGSGSGSGTSGNTNTAPSDPVPYAPYSPLDPTTVQSHQSLGVTVTNSLDVETEYMYDIPVVDIRKYFNCFDLIPSAGATYSIKLCVDLPVNSSPSTSMNFSGGISSGHTFLTITKSGGGTSITQCFGYYPQTHPSLLDPFAPIAAVIKDNGDKEINGAISISINSDQFNTLKTYAISRSVAPYTLNTSNCTDYALSVFNSVRTTPLQIQPYINHQPGIVLANGMSSPGVDITINSSPQQLYNKLATMKSAQDPEASNILLDLSHNTKSPASHGECN
jgi:hypothetical protein